MADRKTDSLPDLLRGHTDSILLFLVDQLGNAYGYQLIKEIERRTGGYLRFKEGTVYPALRKLENTGMLEGEWRNTKPGHERRYYRITSRGRASLQRKLDVWQDFSAAMDLVLKPSEA